MYNEYLNKSGADAIITKINQLAALPGASITSTNITNWNNKDKTQLMVVDRIANNSVALYPYRLYSLMPGEQINNTLTVTFNDLNTIPTGYAAEYALKFIAGTNFNLALPRGILWNGGDAPRWVTGHTYEVSIVDGCASYGEFYA